MQGGLVRGMRHFLSQLCPPSIEKYLAVLWMRRMQGGEMLPMLVVGWRASELRGEEAGRFRKVAGVSIVAVGGPRSQYTI